MRRIFWDSMLLIYLLDGDPRYTARVKELLTVAYERNDRLYTSFLGLGEVLAGAAQATLSSSALDIRNKLDDAGFSFLTFGQGAVETFARLRLDRVKSADAINLACAAAEGIDLFLTGDRALLRLHVPGIHFIADFETPLI